MSAACPAMVVALHIAQVRRQAGWGMQLVTFVVWRSTCKRGVCTSRGPRQAGLQHQGRVPHLSACTGTSTLLAAGDMHMPCVRDRRARNTKIPTCAARVPEPVIGLVMQPSARGASQILIHKCTAHFAEQYLHLSCLT